MSVKPYCCCHMERGVGVGGGVGGGGGGGVWLEFMLNITH